MPCSGGKRLQLEAGNISFQGGLIVFDGEQVGRLLLLHDIAGGFFLRVQGLSGDHAARQRQGGEQGLYGVAFTLVRSHLNLVHDHGAVVAEGRHQLAGVLSHELNHVLQRHGLERIMKSLGLLTVAAIVFGNQQGLVGMMKQLGVELLTLKFSREQETEADLTGLQLLQRAKIDPSGMITFFERLSEKDQGRMEWLSTHPMSAARADRLKSELAALPKKLPEPFTFDWKQVQASLGS